jgi:hypothetical protein
MKSKVIEAWTPRERIQARLTREHEVHERFGRPEVYVFRGVEAVYHPDGYSEKVTTKQAFKTHEQALSAAFAWAEQAHAFVTVWDEIDGKSYVVGDVIELSEFSDVTQTRPCASEATRFMPHKIVVT